MYVAIPIKIAEIPAEAPTNNEDFPSNNGK